MQIVSSQPNPPLSGFFIAHGKSMRNFDVAFEHVISVEGGYVNDPRDPGGETNFGICKRAYPDEDIPNMTLARAKELYKRDYWDKVKGDELPHKLDAMVFDAAVNQGVDAAIKMLQKTIGAAQDGIMGRDTMTKLQSAGKETCARYMAARAMRYIGTRNFDTYGKGWFTRLFLLSMEA